MCDGFMAWLEQARLVPADVIETLRAQAMPGSSTMWRLSARGLLVNGSGGVFGSTVGRPLAPEVLRELEPLNRLLERDEGFGRIMAGDHGGAGAWNPDDAPVALSGAVLLPPIGGGTRRNSCATRIFTREGVRGPGLHADVRRPYARPRTQMVQHGALRQPRKAEAAHRHRLKTQYSVKPAGLRRDGSGRFHDAPQALLASSER